MQAILAGLVMVGVLVVVHEAGHFVVAKLFRIGAPVFSIGMGPRLFGFSWRGTDYRVSMLPVGGYVRMAGADPFGEEDPDAIVNPDEDFMQRPVWQRLLVMFAGPAANLILPFVLFAAVLLLGEPQPGPEIGLVLPSSPAARSGLREGDVLAEVAGRPIDVWADLVLAVGDEHVGRELPLVIVRDGERVDLTLPADAVHMNADGLLDQERLGVWPYRISARIGVDDPTSPAGQAGLRTGDGIVAIDGTPVEDWNRMMSLLATEHAHEVRFARAAAGVIEERTVVVEPNAAWSPRPEDPLANAWGITPVMLYVGTVVEDMPAFAAGMKPDDRLFRVDGRPVRAWGDLIGLVGATVEEAGPEAKPRALEVELVRDGALVTLQFVPRVEREVVRGEPRYRPIMGIQQYPNAFVDGPEVKKYYTVPEALPRAWKEGRLVFTSTLGVLANVATGQLRPKESIGGPIEIFRAAGEGARRGFFTFARLMGTISFSLGIINLLPVPVLDGGQIVFYTIEGIRGRPLSLELRERVQMVGVLALVAVMLMVTVMDVSRWLGI